MTEVVVYLEKAFIKDDWASWVGNQSPYVNIKYDGKTVRSRTSY